MSHDENEKDDPVKLRELFNRSPHPYHRLSFESSDKVTLVRPTRPNDLQLKARRNPSSRRTSPGPSSRHTTSPSDSGTEADDEKPLLRALTAPPLRPRKGLKGLTPIDGTSSPSLSSTESKNEKGGAVPQSLTGSRKSRERAARDRRYHGDLRSFETSRRLFEVILFAVICFISIGRMRSKQWEVFVKHVYIVTLVYAAYIPLLFSQLYRGRNPGRRWYRIWFPASADPASLIYPVFLPLLVTHSIGADDQHVMLSYILSFCAMPLRMVFPGSFYGQWLLTLVPLGAEYMISGFTDPIPIVRTEETVLLFPLHCALMQVLYFLTTTSLLPTELQLLSIALINLLGVPKTPQSSILKALLWVGGLGMLVSCRHVLKLSVELARIPSWRLRKVNRRRKNRSTIYCAIDDSLGGLLSRRVAPRRGSISSDDESQYKQSTVHRTQSLRQSSSTSPSYPAGPAVDDLDYARNSPAFTEDRKFFQTTFRQRRHTLPGNLSTLPDIPTITRTATGALSSAKTRSRLILKLTLPQATVLKWLYAAFVYLVTITIILVPVRLYVQYFALDGNEPVGWALGYLLGNYQPFRMQVVMLSLDSWICLPSREMMAYEMGLVETWRQVIIGSANTRLLICLYCLFWIAAGLIVVIRLSNVVEVDTRRKVFHGMMVAMFLPTIFVDPTFTAMAFTLILAIFLLLDLFRAAQLPPLSKPLTYFLAPYVDGRDHKGPIVISHIFLLIGCAIPLWLSLAAVERTGQGALEGWEVYHRDLSMVTGVICVGMGDAAASLIGRRYGRRRWPWSGGKSLEGSAAFALAVVIGLVSTRVWFMIGGWPGDSGDTWLYSVGKASIAGVGASLTEAVLTGGNDNVIVPVILWLLTRGLSL